MFFYAVANGKDVGVFTNWGDCNASIKGYKNAIYRKFNTKDEAELFIMNNKSSQQDEIIKNNGTFIPDYYVYTDGACSKNGYKNALAGIGIYFGDNDTRNLSQRIEGKQTNNTAELSAVIETYKIIYDDIISGKNIAIVTDSEYVIKCVTCYGEKCYKNNWTNDIPNKELVKNAFELYKDKQNIKFIHIRAHTTNDDIHSIGNYNADKLANISIGADNCPYNKPKSNKIYLNVLFVEKDKIKLLGGKWDANRKKWYITNNMDNKEHILSIFTQA